MKVALKGFLKYKSLDYTINYAGKEKTIRKGMLVTFSNSKQYGNNILISPDSIIDDGLVKLVAVKKFPLIYMPSFAYYLLSKKIHRFRYTDVYESDKITLHTPNKKIHIDGEPIEMDNELKIEVIHKSLNVIAP